MRRPQLSLERCVELQKELLSEGWKESEFHFDEWHRKLSFGCSFQVRERKRQQQVFRIWKQLVCAKRCTELELEKLFQITPKTLKRWQHLISSTPSFSSSLVSLPPSKATTTTTTTPPPPPPLLSPRLSSQPLRVDTTTSRYVEDYSKNGNGIQRIIVLHTWRKLQDQMLFSPPATEWRCSTERMVQIRTGKGQLLFQREAEIIKQDLLMENQFERLVDWYEHFSLVSSSSYPSLV
jgi:hypothetical protein